jgi:hypothetical protein
MTQRSSAWSTERSRSTGAISTPITSKANTWRSLADPKMRCSLSTPGLRLIRTPLGCWRCEATRRTIWAVLSKPNPISNRPCCSVLATLRWASGSICAPTLNASSQTRSLHQMAFETQAGAAVRVRRTAQGGVAGGMSEIHKLVAILVADVFGYSRLAGADEDRTLARLRDVSVSSSVFLAKPSEKEALR